MGSCPQTKRTCHSSCGGMSHPLSHTDVRHAGVKAEGGRRMSVKQRHNQRIFSTRIITFAAIMVALSIVLKRFASITLGPDIRFSLGLVPILLASMYTGPAVGACVGVVADIVGMLIGGQGSFHLGITLTETIRGALPAIIVILFAGRIKFPTIVAVAGAEYVFCSLLLQSIWVSHFTGLPYWQQLLVRLPNSTILLVVHIVVLSLLVPVLNRHIPIAFSAARTRYASN